MKVKYLWLVLLLAMIFLLPAPALADGIIIPEPPICDPGPCTPRPVMGQLSIRYHHVDVKINDQVAVTHVDQVFYNPNDWQIEGTYLFPIPQDAVVTSFTLWVDGQPVQGRVLDATEARQTYEQIVYSLRDPALLEYAGRGAMQARIFPIPPRGERRIELEYSQALTSENGLVRYLYPLNTEKFSAMPLDDVSINVQVSTSSTPIRAVYSPSHPVAINRSSDQLVTAGYEAQNVIPDTDFALLYSLGEEQAFHLITYRDPADPLDADGFFLLMLAPRPDAGEQTLPKDVILVLDRSGSMEGEKFQQARQALQYILNNLNPYDRFNVIVFSTGVDSYAGSLRPASETKEAAAWVDRLNSEGSTDINRALLEAAAITDPERPAYLIFLTDGLPTVGELDSQRILDNLAGSAPDNLRLFVFGVGYDVDTFLLDSLAQEHHGKSTYVTPNDRLDEILSAFYASIRAPVLTNLELDFGGANAYDLYPSPLPDLFAGSQVIVAGRYHDPGVFNVNLSGNVDGNRQDFRFSEQNFSESSGDNALLAAIPRLWATRKIGYLLNRTRLQGPDQETIDQIVRLSIRYGIVTPYTSYLVTEEMPLGAAEQSRIAGEQLSQLQAMPTQAVSGQAAVQKALDQGAMAGAEAPAPSEFESVKSVRQVGARTFVYSDGVWIDTAFDPQTMESVKVKFLSKEYFELIQSQPDLAAGFALGSRVIAFSQGKVYEVVEAGTESAPLPNPEASSLPGSGAEGTHRAPTRTPSGVKGSNPGSSPSQGQGFPCLGGFLPLMLAPLVLFMRRKIN